MLARDFWIDPDAVAYAAEVLGRAETPLARRTAEARVAPRAHAGRGPAAAPVHRPRRRREAARRSARGPSAVRGRRRRARPGRRGAVPTPRHAVRRRSALAPAHHVGRARLAAREAHRVRGRARDRLVGRPQEPARLRSPLLRVLPSEHAGRTTRVRRGRADDRDRARAAEAARRDRARPRSRARGHRGLLFDLELPARASRASTSATR